MKGIIFLWYGVIADIPQGWALCDGKNGTPNLRNFFVFGAGLSKNPGDQFVFPMHSHLFAGESHVHTVIGGDAVSLGTDWGRQLWEFPISGKTEFVTVLPPYKALCYIQKLP